MCSDRWDSERSARNDDKVLWGKKEGLALDSAVSLHYLQGFHCVNVLFCQILEVYCVCDSNVSLVSLVYQSHVPMK